MTPKEQALKVESEYKIQAARELADYKAGKRKSALTKVRYIYPYAEWVLIYNERNDNEEPWFK